MTRTALATAVTATALASLAVAAWTATAAPGDDDTTFTPITPCRLFDDRPAPNTVGPIDTPLTAGDDRTVQITGTTGDCTIPADATAIAMNVTIANPTDQSNLRVWPADQPKPTASNLNWLPGQSPTPNKVDVALSPTGAITLANHQGQVNVIADAVGYYSPTSLTELHSEIDALRSEIDAHTEDLEQLAQRNVRSVEWVTIHQTGSIMFASPGLESARIVRPADEPVGVYCIVVDDRKQFDQFGIVGSLQSSNSAIFDSGIKVTTGFGHDCNSTGHIVGVDTFVENKRADLPFTLIVPRAVEESSTRSADPATSLTE
ncbi:MAG: hypothetical protein AAGA42_13955 [Actinomycetota bacterium]